MAVDKKLETLQEEIKLLKGEVKSSLASVRDYLLNMELPSSEFSTILAALNADGGSSENNFRWQPRQYHDAPNPKNQEPRKQKKRCRMKWMRRIRMNWSSLPRTKTCLMWKNPRRMKPKNCLMKTWWMKMKALNSLKIPCPLRMRPVKMTNSIHPMNRMKPSLLNRSYL